MPHPLTTPRLLAALCLGGACWASAGCGGGGEKLLPVAGRVTLNDQPLRSGSVSFRPDAAKGNASLHHPTGSIDPQGNYSLFTVGKKGAPPGRYKVLVFADANAQAGAVHPVPPRWLVPEKYLSEKSTPLAVEVVDAPAEGAYDLKLGK
jgi:hypothetical protein